MHPPKPQSRLETSKRALLAGTPGLSGARPDHGSLWTLGIPGAPIKPTVLGGVTDNITYYLAIKPTVLGVTDNITYYLAIKPTVLGITDNITYYLVGFGTPKTY